jgi:hypothetical protein
MGIVFSSLVIVDQVDVSGMAGLEAEDDAPVARDADGPIAFHISREGVKLEARKIHFLWIVGFVEAGKDTPDLVHPLRREALAIVSFIEPFEPAMPKALDHAPMYGDTCRMSKQWVRVLFGPSSES